MKKEATQKEDTGKRIVILEKGKAIDKGIGIERFTCCTVAIFPLRFW